MGKLILHEILFAYTIS